MKLDILIAGIGGQGAVLLGRFIRSLFFYKFPEAQISGTESRGVSQREGSVVSQVRIIFKDNGNEDGHEQSDQQIAPEIPQHEADLIIAMEPLEFARSLPYISNNTLVVCNGAEIPPKNVMVGQITGEGSHLSVISDVFKSLQHLYKTVEWTRTLNGSFYNQESISNYLSLGDVDIHYLENMRKLLQLAVHGTEVPILAERFADVKFFYGNFTKTVSEQLQTSGLLNMLLMGFISCYFSKLLSIQDYHECITLFFGGETANEKRIVELNMRAFDLGVSLMSSLLKTRN